jgi:hypothetical protein
MGSLETPQSWAQRHFSAIEMGDVRRVARVVTIAEAMARTPGATIPQMFEEPYAVKAAYQLFSHQEATPDRLQAGHRALVQQQLAQAGTYLLLEDTSELSWHDCQPRAGLGPLGSNSPHYQGVHLHSVLAVQWPASLPPLSQDKQRSAHRPAIEIIGLCDQQYYIRQQRPAGEPDEASCARKKRERESQLWERATRRLGPNSKGAAVRWVRVCDRGADIYEHLKACQQAGHGFVIRASQDRALVEVGSGHRDHNGGRLFATAQVAPALGEFALELRARPQQAARMAQLRVSATRVALRAPQRPGCSAGSQAPLHCSVIRVWEIDAPAGVEPLEWVLLCDQEVTEFDTAHHGVLQYATRWLIEEFHKALKSGLGVERLQLKTAERLFAAIALLSVVALRLLDLREHLRVAPAQPAAECGLESLELEVLRLQSSRVIATVQDVALALGRLGGHLNRRGDGLPGWQVLWRGMQQLQTLVEGVRLASRLQQKFG